jgi:hypothetical protein
MPEWIFWVGGFLLIAGLGAYGAAQRTKQAEALARKLGFRFIGSGGYDVLGPFVLLGYPTTIGPGIANIARGERDGVEVTLFDHNTESNGFTAVVMHAPGLEVPHVAAQPPSMKNGKGRIIFRPRLSIPFEFPERPGFKQLYWATAETPAGLEVFTPALLERLERDPGFYLEGLGDRVLVAKTRLQQNGVSRLLTDDEVPAFLDEAMELFRLVAVRRGWAPPGAS